MLELIVFTTHLISFYPVALRQKLADLDLQCFQTKCGSQVYKTLFIHNSTEHEISTAHKN